MHQLHIIQPSELLHPADGTLPDFAPYKYKFLAQGDSWFSIGAVPPTGTTSIIKEMILSAPACAVNCAHPGFQLRRMVSAVRDPAFTQLLVGNQAWRWDGILMSAGGNDLIDAIQVMPNYGKNHPKEGKPIPKSLRILLRSDEWTPTSGPRKYLSDDGWGAFSSYFKALVDELHQLRDSSHSLSKGVPLFLHCYDYLIARNAPASLGIGPWLYPALVAYRVPQQDWEPVGVELIKRFQSLLNSLVVPNLHIVQTPGTLAKAALGSTGESYDWVNEIHPTKAGYQLLSAVYGAAVDAFFP